VVMVVLTPATENYLKSIFAMTSIGELVTTGGLAHELGVSSPSVTAMVKRLQDAELLERSGGRAVRLTGRGEQLALRVVRRHRLLETFLVAALDLGWDEVHAEAELLEHALSERLEDRIDALLGHPTRDPHGDPIPPRVGRHDEAWGQRLDTAPAACRFRVERVSDRDSAALRYLGEMGVVPGAVLDVAEQTPFGGPLWIVIDGHRHGLGAPLTRLVHGHIDPEHGSTEHDTAEHDVEPAGQITAQRATTQPTGGSVTSTDDGTGTGTDRPAARVPTGSRRPARTVPTW